MRKLVLHQKVAPPDRIRAWVGIADHADVPALEWRLDGLPVVPTVVSELAPAYAYSRGAPATITGVLDFGVNLAPKSAHVVDVAIRREGVVVDNDSITASVLPEEITGDPLSIMLGSCFSTATDKGGDVGSLVGQIVPTPVLTLLVGDQVYLDADQIGRVSGNEEEFARDFERQYRNNWMGSKTGIGLDGYARLLHWAPTATIPDDHEYWNNYPRRQPHLPVTWTEHGHKAWAAAALAMYKAFQGVDDVDGGCQVIDVYPLSICLLDNRTRRDAVPGMSMTEDAHEELAAWVEGMLQSVDGVPQRRIPILVTGPSLIQPARSFVERRLDANLADFDDYSVIMNHVRRLQQAGYPVLLLTGDVHYPRISKGVLPSAVAATGGSLVEIISSPMSLVNFPGLDQVHEQITRRGAVAARWPRVKKPQVDHHVALNFTRVFPDPDTDRDDDVYGDHVAVLTFEKPTSTGIQLTVRYYLINKDETKGSQLGAQPPVSIPLTWNFVQRSV